MLHRKVLIGLVAVESLALIVIGVIFVMGQVIEGGNGRQEGAFPGDPTYEEYIPPYVWYLEDIGKSISGFGGHYKDEEDKAIVYVYMLDPSRQKQAARALVIGYIREVRTLQADYAMTDLVAWTRLIISELRLSNEVAGPVYVKEAANRLVVGIYDTTPASEVEQKLAELGIPREAVVFEEWERIEKLLAA